MDTSHTTTPGAAGEAAGAEDLPSTQPVDGGDEPERPDSQESDMDVDQSQVFGYLLPLKHMGLSTKPKSSMVSLKDNEPFTVGRSPNASYKIQNSSMKYYDSISKSHFNIQRASDGRVYLQDESSNGTFVNGKRVGKSKKVVLSHNDAIGLAIGKIRHFVYMTSDKNQLQKYPKELRSKYMVSRELGKGASGTVYLGVRKTDHLLVAIKAISKKTVTMMQPASVHNVMNEVKLLRQIDHPCIIRLEDVVETKDDLFIILELADGGELFEKIIEKTKLQEAEAKLHFYQIVSAIEYLHSKNIAHRDLKPENILLYSDDDLNPVIKVTDLGLSKFVDTSRLKTFCGTSQYLAPEILISRVRGDGSYDLKVDMWSLGVILYILLCGCPPFNSEKSKPLARQVADGDYSFPNKLWAQISPSAIDLVKKLMTVDPQQRLSALATLEHPWMKDDATVTKACNLMASQRVSPVAAAGTSNVSVLNGILPDDCDSAYGSHPVSLDSSTSNGSSEPSETSSSSKKEETFKRPLEHESGTPSGSKCKRTRKNE